MVYHFSTGPKSAKNTNAAATLNQFEGTVTKTKAVESLRASLNIVTANLQDSVQGLSTTVNDLSTDVQRKADAAALKELGSVVATRTDDLLRVVARKANAEDVAQLAEAVDGLDRR